MKCACGYERKTDIFGDKTEVGDENFIRLKGYFAIDDDFNRRDREVQILACPKCGTLKIADL